MDNKEILIDFPDNYIPNANGIRVYTDGTLSAHVRGEIFSTHYWQWKVSEPPFTLTILIKRDDKDDFNSLHSAFVKPILNALAERAMLE